MTTVEIIASGVRLDGRSLEIGEAVDIENGLANKWFEKNLAKPYKEQKKKEDLNENESSDEELKHLGAGWYRLPNGEKVQGKKEALAELEKLKAKTLEDGNDDSEADNSTK